MDPFKRALLLTIQEVTGQLTSDELRTEAKKLIPLMQADTESQPDPPAAAQTEATPGYQPPNY